MTIPESPPRRNRVLALVLSFVLVLTGIVGAIGGLSIAIQAGIDAGQQGERADWIAAAALILVGIGLIVAAVVFVSHLRPWLIRRLTGCEVPRVPKIIAWMATAESYGN